MYSQDELRDIFRRLAEPFPEEAVERTKASVTRKGYDTTGYKYTYIVQRLNEVLGVGGFRVQPDFTIKERKSRNGAPLYDVTCDLIMQLGRWDAGKFLPFAEAPGTGGHTSTTEADAKKGSFTNGFKKVAAFFGCGWQAYAGCIDDDNLPPAHDDWHDAESDATERVSNPPVNGRDEHNGRITSGQLAKMRELVDEVGGDWARFREHVRKERNVNVEYANRKMASEIIEELIQMARRRRSNGTGREVAS